MKRFGVTVGVFSILALGLCSCALLAQSAGTITTVAGDGMPGTTGDGAPATDAELGIGNLSITPDYQGNLYILDQQTNRLRKVNPAGIITTIGGGTSAAVTVQVNSFGPAFFGWPNNQVVATRQDFSFAVKNGTFAGTTMTPAKPGETIIFWGTGFGSTIPAAPPGIATPSGPTTYNTATKPIVEIDSVAATVDGAALAPGLAGLYQVAIQVPTTLADGDWPVVATIGGVSSPSAMVLTVQQ